MKEWQCGAYLPIGVILPHSFLAPVGPKLMTQSLMFCLVSATKVCREPRCEDTFLLLSLLTFLHIAFLTQKE